MLLQNPLSIQNGGMFFLPGIADKFCLRIAGLGGVENEGLIHTGTPIETWRLLRLQVGTYLYSQLMTRCCLSSAPVTNAMQLALSLLNNNDVQNIGLLSMGSGAVASVFHNVTAEIYLDGRPLSNRVLSPIVISYDESSVHNSLSFSSTDPDLYRLCDPMLMPGEIRIEAQVGTRMMQFIIVERPGEDINFFVEAISVSAKEDEFASDIDFTMTEPKLASAIAASLTEYCPVTWSAFDWVVPASFSFSGKPIDGILQLAGAIGAVVRCQDDGSLLVRRKRPVRPVDMPVTAAAVDYTDANLLTLSQNDEAASGYNAIEVFGSNGIAGDEDGVFLPGLQIEEESPVQGETVHVRVFWGTNTPAVDDAYVTAGSIEIADGGTFTEIEQTEIVEFTNGTGSVSLPVKAITSYSWIGTPAGVITETIGATDLIVPELPGFGIAEVKYTAEYQRYKLTGHDVEQLIAVFFIAAGTAVDVVISTSSDDPVYAPAITEELLTSDAAAVERGMAEIDAMKYRKSILSVSAPYLDAAIDGTLAHVNDPHISAIGNYHIKSSTIEIDGPKITNTLGLEQCLIS